MKRIYISGPMTGLPDLNFPAFNAAAERLRRQGHSVVNPAEIGSEPGRDWVDYMKADIKALCDCDALALLPGWQNSKGAHLELHLAHRLGLEIGTVDEYQADVDAARAAGKYVVTSSRGDTHAFGTFALANAERRLLMADGYVAAVLPPTDVPTTVLD